MLDEYKKLYKDNANLIDGWEKIDRNDLCRYYVDNKDKLSKDKQDSYLSAIIYKFWNLIKFTYNKQLNSIIVLSYEDCYELLIESILYVLEHAVWNNKDSSLYNDKKAPEKAISIRMKSISGNEKYLSLFTSKKKINNLAYSLEYMQEESEASDGYYLKSTEDTDDFLYNDLVKTYIKKCIENCDHFNAIVLDLIFSDNYYVDGEFDLNRLNNNIRKLDLSYVKSFCEEYDTDENSILFGVNLLKQLKIKDLSNIVNNIKVDIMKVLGDD